MKTLLTIALLFTASFCFGQNKFKKQFDKAEKSITTASSSGITVTDDIRLQQLGLDRKIDLSKGELLTIQQHEEDVKRSAPGIKAFFKRDSVYNYMFLNNTISPYILPGDTLQTYEKVGDQIILHFKPKKK